MQQPPTSASPASGSSGGEQRETAAAKVPEKETAATKSKNVESATSGSGPADLGPSELILRHQRGVWRYLRVLGCDPTTADDLTQETFLRVLRRDNFVQHNDQATAGYLRRTAHNLLISRHRKQGRMHAASDSAVLDEIWDRWAGKDGSGDVAIDALQDCLQSLSERARKALKMRFADDVSRVEIGSALGISDHGARNLMQRAKQQLRECVEEKLSQAEIE